MKETNTKQPDVIVVGAGAAGICAALDLQKAGLEVIILEARDRIGGRIFTLQDAKLGTPIELGAEFIHGCPPELWSLLNAHKVSTYEVDGDNWCVEDGLLGTCDFFADVDEILRKMDDRGPDQSFLEFLKKYDSRSKNHRRQERAEAWAKSYVTGFNAADPALVSVHWLVQEMRAEEKIEGSRAFRAEQGYSALIKIFEQELANSKIEVQKNTIVEAIHWGPAHVEVVARSSNDVARFSANRVLITVPLGVLQARSGENGAIQFTPELPRSKQEAIRAVLMGSVIRVTLRFRERFWESLPLMRAENSKTMDRMSFLFSHDDWFPTWWTLMPKKSPILIGWAPFRCAQRLAGKNEAFVVEQAINALHRLLGLSALQLQSLLEHAYVNDWQSDPFSRGAYSYGKVGESHAQARLARSVAETLFFAGEATDIEGNNGTVHGAMASGLRAAAEIKKTMDQ